MPKDSNIQSILVIGSGPIVIGQAAEFDYAGTQACIALKEEGYRVILVNNNPATIMTDSGFADKIYFEPLTVDTLEKIIAKERPDGLLATLGGQTGLNLALELNEQGILQKYEVRMLGSSIDSIKKGEDREAFRALMHELNEPVPESVIVHSVGEAVEFAEDIGFPIIVRPAYTLGGTGGGIASTMDELTQLVRGGLQESAIHQCLVERSIAGYKEIEYEVMRDGKGNCMTICSMENIDPVGVHTGDSIVVAPALTLTDEEANMLRNAAIKIISGLGIVGGCNIQYALDPNSMNYYLIEVNPRVSRSSALASKATGVPIASMTAKIAVGYSLEEIFNPFTDNAYQDLEPLLDYVVVKFPKWPFDKFPEIERRLGTQMKATGEVMAIDRSFERAMMKAIHSLEIDINDLSLPHLAKVEVEQLEALLKEQNDERFFIILELLRRGISIDELHEITKINPFFLSYFAGMLSLEKQINQTSFDKVTKKELQLFKEKGFSDSFLAKAWKSSEKEIRNKRKIFEIIASYKMVDSCAAEFEAKSNYFYSSYFGENEQVASDKKKVLIIGSGPIRIGQGVEFDYCTVHAVFSLKDEGVETVMINNNPETVSTDYATADRLYFEPLTIEYILNVMEAENIKDVIIQLGGQTAINLAKDLEEYDINILGTRSATIDMFEDRELFYRLLDELEIPHLAGDIVHNKEELIAAARKIGYPVLLRPSFVIGGRGMVTIHDETALSEYLENEYVRFPFLVDQFLHAKEAELDLVTDGKTILAPTIMEHIEKTGVHSGDSMSVLPAITLSKNVQGKMIGFAERISQHLDYKGLMNIQYIVDGEDVYILEVNPRASRTVPIVSKVTGIPLVKLATKVLLGKYSLAEIAKVNNLIDIPFFCVKYPVFSNYALKGLDSKVSAEMRSTGEGICLGESLEEAIRKAFHSSLKALSQARTIVVKDDSDKEIFEDALTIDGYQIIQSNDESLLNEDAMAYYNPYSDKDDRNLREFATKRRIITFTERESLLAFISSLTINDFSVKAIEDWHLQLREDVKAL